MKTICRDSMMGQIYCQHIKKTTYDLNMEQRRFGWTENLWLTRVREAPFNKSPPLFGHCPNSNYTPPRTQTGTLGHFFSGAILPFFDFYHFFYHFHHFSLNKCPKPSGQGFRPPQHQANARLNLENSCLKKCPKPSGQGLRPPPYGQCPNRGDAKFKGVSLSKDDWAFLCFECNTIHICISTLFLATFLPAVLYWLKRSIGF